MTVEDFAKEITNPIWYKCKICGEKYAFIPEVSDISANDFFINHYKTLHPFEYSVWLNKDK